MSILITGGTGSLGRALVKRLLTTNLAAIPEAERIVILSRGEHAQADMQRQFAALDPETRLHYFIGDVRDLQRLKRAFYGVSYVIHAAALKRIEVGHYNPIEMVKTNIQGAINVIEAAHDNDVARAVLVSSDKAWQPVSPYGLSKAMAENLFLNAYQGRTEFAVCRYGNVWKSQGSVVPLWQEQLAAGLTLKITEPKATRFFMTMDQAVDLVLETLAEGERIVIPKDLPAYRLADLLRAVSSESADGRLPIEVTGLPPWEKEHEGLAPGYTSDKARKMTVDELRGHL